MEVFLRNLAGRDELPGGLVLLNAGVKLATRGFPVLDHLKWLEECGVGIVCCRTFLEYLQLLGKIAADKWAV
ncbi:MAG: hypothetical protein ACUVRS_05665 [Armatimonadota bacterium]